MAVIEAHEATIRTAAVEIRTLTVTGKQVTLAVFRQLQEERIEDDEGNLRGEPWGRVNYHPDKCAGGQRHLHVVWQLGGELRRSKAGPPDPPGEWFGTSYRDRTRARWVEGVDTWRDVAVLNGWRPAPGTIISDKDVGRVALVAFTHRVGMTIAGPVADLLAAEQTLRSFEGQPEDWACDRVANAQRQIAKAKAAIAGRFDNHEGVPSLADATRWVEEDLRLEDEEHARRVANWERFQTLPQLFIAV